MHSHRILRLCRVELFDAARPPLIQEMVSPPLIQEMVRLPIQEMVRLPIQELTEEKKDTFPPVPDPRVNAALEEIAEIRALVVGRKPHVKKTPGYAQATLSTKARDGAHA